MRPIYIDMKAFGSYIDERIEFDKVDHGLFLITGPTGAGKTTIFDAITYALYGKTSGSMRTEKMVHSQYAKKEMRTEVTYCFSYGSDVYTIVRKAGQEKYKRNKDGSYTKYKTDYLEEVELTMPDGKPFDGKKTDIDRKIIDIIKLSPAQFKQVVMLAQGEFTDLLKAKSNDRQEIFMKIFDNSIYTAIESESKNRYNEAYGVLEDTKNKILDSLQTVQIPSDSVYKEQWAQLSDGFRVLDKDLLLETLFQVNQEIETKKKALDETISELERKETDQTTLLKNAQDLNQNIDNAEKKEKEFQSILEADARYAALEKQVEKAGRANVVQTSYRLFINGQSALEKKKTDRTKLDEDIQQSRQKVAGSEQKKEHAQRIYETEGNKLTGQISTLEAGFEQYEKLDALLEQREKIDQQIKSAESVHEANEQALKNQKQEAQEIEACQQELLKRKKEPEYFDILIQRSMEKKDKLEELEKDLETIATKKSLLKKTETERNEKEGQMQKAFQEYDTYYALFLSDQAALVRSTLEEGKPCPVCGSIHRTTDLPDLPNHATSAEVLDQKKKTYDTYREQWEQLKTDYIKLHQEMDLVQQAIERNPYRAYDPEKEITVCEKEIKKNGDLKQQTIKDQQAMDANEKKLNRQKEEMEQLEETLQENRKNMQDLQNRRTALLSQIQTIKETLPFGSLAQAKQHTETLKSQREQFRNDYLTAQKVYEEEYNHLNAQVASRKTMDADIQALESEQVVLNETFIKELHAQGFQSEKDFTDAILDMESIRKSRRAIADHKERKNLVQGQYHTLRALIEGKERVDTTVIKEAIDQIQTQKQNLRIQRDEVVGMMQVNRHAYTRCHTLYEQYTHCHQTFEDIRDIYVVICGKTRSQHLDFKTFILRKYFKQMLAKANERLIRLSHNQFILKCVDIEDLGNRGSVGLDLNVVHLVTNEERDAKSLSGGESFMAALSMALGMADLIQLNNGNVRIDTMFIDEGFGSLSDDVRNEAVSILNELTDENRLIGIISHVNELKAQVDTKLVIEKDEQGSHHHWEY